MNNSVQSVSLTKFKSANFRKASPPMNMINFNKFLRVNSRVNVLKGSDVSKNTVCPSSGCLAVTGGRLSCGPVFIPDPGAGADPSASQFGERCVVSYLPVEVDDICVDTGPQHNRPPVTAKHPDDGHTSKRRCLLIHWHSCLPAKLHWIYSPWKYQHICY